jgi:hypothetical protein
MLRVHLDATEDSVYRHEDVRKDAQTVCYSWRYHDATGTSLVRSVGLEELFNQMRDKRNKLLLRSKSDTLCLI